MKAIVQHEYGSPEVLRLEDVDEPVVGEKDEEKKKTKKVPVTLFRCFDGVDGG